MDTRKLWWLLTLLCIDTVRASSEIPPCPCIPAHLCPRVFGESPLDEQVTGPMKPCQEPGTVHCCGATTSKHEQPLEMAMLVAEHLKKEQQIMAAIDNFLERMSGITLLNSSDQKDREDKSITSTSKNKLGCDKKDCKDNKSEEIETTKDVTNYTNPEIPVQEGNKSNKVFIVYAEKPKKNNVYYEEKSRPHIVLPTKELTEEISTTAPNEETTPQEVQTNESIEASFEDVAIESNTNQTFTQSNNKFSSPQYNSQVHDNKSNLHKLFPKRHRVPPSVSQKPTEELNQSQEVSEEMSNVEAAASEIYKIRTIAPLNTKRKFIKEREEIEAAGSEMNEVQTTSSLSRSPINVANISTEQTNEVTKIPFKPPPRRLRPQPVKTGENKQTNKNVLDLLRVQTKTRPGSTSPKNNQETKEIPNLPVQDNIHTVTDQINMKVINNIRKTNPNEQLFSLRRPSPIIQSPMNPATTNRVISSVSVGETQQGQKTPQRHIPSQTVVNQQRQTPLRINPIPVQSARNKPAQITQQQPIQPERQQQVVLKSQQAHRNQQEQKTVQQPIQPQVAMNQQELRTPQEPIQPQRSNLRRRPTQQAIHPQAFRKQHMQENVQPIQSPAGINQEKQNILQEPIIQQEVHRNSQVIATPQQPIQPQIGRNKPQQIPVQTSQPQGGKNRQEQTTIPQQTQQQTEINRQAQTTLQPQLRVNQVEQANLPHPAQPQVERNQQEQTTGQQPNQPQVPVGSVPLDQIETKGAEDSKERAQHDRNRPVVEAEEDKMQQRGRHRFRSQRPNTVLTQEQVFDTSAQPVKTHEFSRRRQSYRRSRVKPQGSTSDVDEKTTIPSPSQPSNPDEKPLPERRRPTQATSSFSRKRLRNRQKMNIENGNPSVNNEHPSDPKPTLTSETKVTSTQSPNESSEPVDDLESSGSNDHPQEFRFQPRGRFIPPQHMEGGFQPMVHSRSLNIVGPVPKGFTPNPDEIGLDLPEPNFQTDFNSNFQSDSTEKPLTLLPPVFPISQPPTSSPISSDTSSFESSDENTFSTVLQQHRDITELQQEFSVLKTQYDMLLNRYAETLNSYIGKYKTLLSSNPADGA